MHIKDYQERQTTEKGTRRERLIRELQRLAYEILCGICAGNSGNQVTLFKSLPLFLEDLFRGNGAEELLMEIFRGNYSLQWKVPHQLPELGNRNIVKAVL